MEEKACIRNHLLSQINFGIINQRNIFTVLTDKEREVLQLLAEGKSTKQIADSLYVSIKTIETHRRHIMDKIKLYSIAELTKYAIREGLTSAEF